MLYIHAYDTYSKNKHNKYTFSFPLFLFVFKTGAIDIQVNVRKYIAPCSNQIDTHIHFIS